MHRNIKALINMRNYNCQATNKTDANGNLTSEPSKILQIRKLSVTELFTSVRQNTARYLPFLKGRLRKPYKLSKITKPQTPTTFTVIY